MSNELAILGANGKPLAPSRVAALAGGGAPYDAADSFGEHFSAWRPFLWSPDAETNVFRDRVVARIRDLVRNDGWASAAVTRTLDNVIGANFRPIAKPDYRYLAAYSGIKAFDATWADEYGRFIEAHYRAWALDPGRYCDAGRRLTAPQIYRLAFRHKLVDGDALALSQWLPGRVGPGRAVRATTVQLIDPDRLSNPNLAFDSQTRRGGVEVDEFGAAVGYHIRRAHQGDWWAAEKSVTWDYIARETRTGRPIVIHDFDHDRADQHRGAGGIFMPVVKRVRQIARMDEVELDASIVNAVFAAYIESPFDQSMVQDALGDSIGPYQELRAGFHDEKRTSLGGVRMPILFPGEKINTVASTRPNANFADFEQTALRNIAAATGLSAQQLSNNWSDVNYSSARGAMLEAWKTLIRRRADFGIGFCSPIYANVVEEIFATENVPLPYGAPDFLACRAAYAACRWMGPGRGWVDPVAEKQGAVLGMDAGLSTLEDEVAENAGADWEEQLDQRKREIEAFRERGLPVPTWANMQTAGDTPGQRDNATPPKPQPK